MRKKSKVASFNSHHLDRRAGFIIEMMKAEGEADDLLTTDDIAYYFGVHPSWCEITRHVGKGPPFIKLSPRRVRYRRDEVIAWLRERVRLPATTALARFASMEARA